MTEAATGGSSWPPVLIVMALPVESQSIFERAGVPVLFSGLGKVNAAMALMRRLMQYRSAHQPLPRVVNFGSAGSRQFDTGALVACRRFVQRDMDVSALGFALGHTPFEDLPAELQFPPVFTHLPEGLCGSGDSFETGAARLHCEVVDMEAYALAKVCRREQVGFAAAKFVTDGGDASAHQDWSANLPLAAAAFRALYDRLVGAG